MEGFTEQDVYEPPPPADYLWDGTPLISEDTYSRTSAHQRIFNSKGTEYEGRVVMRGSRDYLRMRHAVGLSTTWRGFASIFTERYFRRYYKGVVFFENDDIRPILRKIADRFPMYGAALKSYYSDFVVYEMHRYARLGREYSILIDGNQKYMERDEYMVVLRINNQINKLEKLERMKDEQEKRN